MSFEEIKRDDIAEVVLVLLTERSMKALREDSNGNDTPLLPYTRATGTLALIPRSILHIHIYAKNVEKQNNKNQQQ